MCVFTGDFLIKLDAKGRFLFPSAFVEQMGSDGLRSFVVKKDIFEKCLTIYTSTSWQERVDVVKSRLNPFNRQHNVFLREFFKDTAEVTLDSTNRFQVPKRLLTDSGLKDDIIIIGLDDKIEVWDADTYNAARPSADDFASMAQEFLGNLSV